ncbi:MAG: thiolase family protein, partial [Chlorobiales bacterium]|nr:thiolase family protein [Chlorobiales bacterium]
SLAAPELGAIALKEALTRSGVEAKEVDECIMGNVLSAGLGQAPARQTALYAGLPPSVECLTINKMCGSGLKSVMLGAQAIMMGDAGVIAAGGIESMSNAPYLLPKARNGYRMGHGEVLDSIIHDGLWDVYNKYLMGNAAELCAKECHIPREAQDAFTIESYERARKAQKDGLFKAEIIPVTYEAKGKTVVVSDDEEPQNFRPDKIPTLRPAFLKDGTVTAANASKINDGASVTILASEFAVKSKGLKPLAKVVAQASAAKAPEWFTTAPIDVIPKVLKKAGLRMEDIDLFEINEAFAVVALAAQNTLCIDPGKLNVHGGAVALGHPIGASGNRILVTLLHALKQRGLKRGLAAICIGGGEASAVIVETV